MDRSPDALIALVIGFNVQNNPLFVPGVLAVPVAPGDKADCVFQGQALKLMRYTRCNGYAQAISVALGCPLPAYMTANQLQVWLAGDDAKARGWRSCTYAEATARAQLGLPVVIVATDNPHGHIGFGVPSPNEPTTLYCTAAGSTNTPKMRMVDQFGRLAAVAVYFTHD